VFNSAGLRQVFDQGVQFDPNKIVTTTYIRASYYVSEETFRRQQGLRQSKGPWFWPGNPGLPEAKGLLFIN